MPQMDMLSSTVLDATRGGHFDTEQFFRSWFRDKGTVLHFLFKKNLGVTNIQYAELIALLRQHVKSATGEPFNGHLLFYNRDDFCTLVDEIAASYRSAGYGSPELSMAAGKLYSEMLARAVIINPYYTSCYVALPPGLIVTLEHICGEPGYIHSCGRAVFSGRFQESRYDDLVHDIDEYLRRHPPIAGKKLRLIPYTHEDFSADDNEREFMRDNLQNGLDGAKLRIAKLNMDGKPLIDVLRDLKAYFSSRIEFLRKDEVTAAQDTDASRTIWIVADLGIDVNDIRRPGAEQYYICYDQVYFNDNPFQFFEEEKPAWKTHTTTPHSLAAAMLNSTKPWSGPQSVMDPFGGTGTTFFEVLRQKGATFSCGDADPVARQLLVDNIQFFGLSSEELISLTASLGVVVELVKSSIKAARINAQALDEAEAADPNLKDKSEFRALRAVVMDTDELWSGAQRESNIDYLPRTIIDKLSNLGMLEKIIFYTMLRARNRYFRSIGWGSKQGREAFSESLSGLLERILAYGGWLKRYEDSVTSEDDTVSEFSGKYSRSVTGNMALIRQLRHKEGATVDRAFVLDDVVKLPERAFDIVVGDPPYGFNTDEDFEKLAELYSAMIPRMIAALRNGGRLLLCLPLRSFTGRQLPFFARREFVVSQVITSARNKQRKVVRYPDMVPLPRSLFALPYYWYAEKALGRSIVHFTIVDY